MHEKNRSRLTFQLAYAVKHPDKIASYAKRRNRDARLRREFPDHVSYYRAIMADDTARDPERAVGSHTHEEWLEIGQMQFDYAVRHGLWPGARVLDIGCGNLRAGRLFIDFLEPGRYYGADISPDILLQANETVVQYGLQDKLPHLTLIRDLKLAFLPDRYFDFVHAHSVFSHSPIEVIEECLANVGRVMAHGAFFDFTFDKTEGEEHHVLNEDFYYRTQTLIDLAARHGLTAKYMDDWETTGHEQSKIRVSAGD